jgi:2-dehydro-3-deoxyphosphogluconate aldolase/(4S)-4-hydroxy-2-oxoglutarate aldolase
MDKSEKIKKIRETGIIAIIRAKSSDNLMDAAEAVRAGGVDVIEVTMNTPRALDVIATATDRYGENVLFGAGTVLDGETARSAILAGASFIVAPTLNLSVVDLCHRYSTPVIPGCYTPTEMLSAWEAGADFIKLFPASMGGPALIKAIRAPLPQLEIVPVGGVNMDTAAEFIKAGAAALGVGSDLIDQSIVDKGKMAEITKRAAAFIEEVKKGWDARKGS